MRAASGLRGQGRAASARSMQGLGRALGKTAGIEIHAISSTGEGGARHEGSAMLSLARTSVAGDELARLWDRHAKEGRQRRLREQRLACTCVSEQKTKRETEHTCMQSHTRGGETDFSHERGPTHNVIARRRPTWEAR